MQILGRSNHKRLTSLTMNKPKKCQSGYTDCPLFHDEREDRGRAIGDREVNFFARLHELERQVPGCARV
jgi:hypothetical protein